ncbi:MAG: DinB family protein [Cyclobacteriaceae bacterium]
MNARIQKRLDKIERLTHELQQKVKPFEHAFHQKPDSRSWSLHQVLAHLVAAEKLSVQYLTKKINGINEVGNTGIYEEAKMVVVKLSQRLPFKFKAPTRVVESTTTYDNLESLFTDWHHTRQSLRQLLETIEDRNVKKRVFKHIIAGKLNVLHAIDFMHEHINHHLPQINRLLK